jgi:hypothetical protein
MATRRLSEKDLKGELAIMRERFPRLPDDDLFVLWFLRAFVTDSEEQAAKALVGGSGDKSVDAVFIDEHAKLVFVVQGKYRETLLKRGESRSDVLALAQLAPALWGESKLFSDLCEGMAPAVRQRLEEGRERLRSRKYNLKLMYVTLGKCSEGVRKEAARLVRQAEGNSEIEVLTGRQIMLLLSDYLDGVAPPVASLDLEMEAGGGVRGEALHRFDARTKIDSWVFSMTGGAIAELYAQAGDRLFARNVRGFLGSTEINRGMEETLEKEPEHFWYYNNGITVICDEAERVTRGGRDVLKVSNPQVINGQQTTRTLHREAKRGQKASVIVRVIRVPRDVDQDVGRFETLVSSIVAATNWQNAIRPSDLMSSDRRQIEVDRELRKVGYYYVRKRQKKSEARRAAGSRRWTLVRKEEIAQAVAACDLDPSIVRQGKERLFEERLYPDVYPTTDASYYLSRYWLAREVSYAARGYPERAYAKWLVLHHMWKSLAPLVRSRAGADTFRILCERGGDASLTRATDVVFVSALRFYRARRGSGQKAADVSTFFKRRGLHNLFERFWRGSGGGRRRFRNAWSKYEAKLKQTAGGVA